MKSIASRDPRTQGGSMNNGLHAKHFRVVNCDEKHTRPGGVERVKIIVSAKKKNKLIV